MGFGELRFIQLVVPRLGKVWPPWALLRYLEAIALLLGAKSGDVEGKLGLSGGHVEAKLGYVTLCFVEAICQILFGHVVGFASRSALPPAGPRFKEGFCQLCWPHLGLSKATLWLRWCHLGANYGDFGAVEGYTGAFWTMLLRHLRCNPIQPKDTPPKGPPLA